MKSVRRLLHEDCGEVLLINADCLPGVARLDRAEFERLLDLPNSHIVAIAPDETVIGYALAFPDHAPYDGEEFELLLKTCRRPFLYIDQVAVRTTVRRTGVASTLYNAIEADARSRSMSGLCCEVNLSPPNPTSIAFHRNMGFECCFARKPDPGFAFKNDPPGCARVWLRSWSFSWVSPPSLSVLSCA